MPNFVDPRSIAYAEGQIPAVHLVRIERRTLFAYSASGGGAICSIVHCRGALSGRQRKSRVPCRKRSPVTWSKRTSTTSSGLSGSHWPLRSVLQRLGPPGAPAGKAGRRAQGFEPSGERMAFAVGDGRGEADVIEPAVVVVEAEQQRADHSRLSLS